VSAHGVLGLVERIVIGRQVDGAVRRISAVIASGWLAVSGFWAFMSIWSISHLGASDQQLAIALVAAAVAAALASVSAGELADRIGPRATIVLGRGLLSLIAIALAASEPGVAAGLVLLISIAAINALAPPAEQMAISSASASNEQEEGFGVARIAQTTGFVAGPLLGALTLAFSWRLLFVMVAAISTLSVILAARWIPARQPDRRESLTSDTPSALGDPLFLAFLAGVSLAMVVYFSFEILLPLSLTESHGLSPTTWGLIAGSGAAAVALLQVRLIVLTHAMSASQKIALGVILMGVPFTLLLVYSSLWFICLVVGAVLVGQMLWLPAAQAATANFAPSGREGSYFGALRATFPVGLAIGPFLGLQARSAFGDMGMWIVVGGVAVGAAAVLFVSVLRGASRVNEFRETVGERTVVAG
jgi:predicted MFS family arabinose efflux permease